MTSPTCHFRRTFLEVSSPLTRCRSATTVVAREPSINQSINQSINGGDRRRHQSASRPMSVSYFLHSTIFEFIYSLKRLRYFYSENISD